MLANAPRALALAVALTLAGTVGATPAGKEGPRKETTAEALRKSLEFGITLELTDIPLANVLQQLADMAKVTIVLDRSASPLLSDPMEMLVSLKAKDMKLRTCLRTITGQHGLTFAIVGDHILVSTEEIVNFRQLRQRISVDLDGESLAKGLKELATQTATNLIIDPRSLKNADAVKVTLQLDDVPLETAVRLMAEMGGLKPVRMGNVLFVTSEERAEKLKVEVESPAPSPLPPGATINGGPPPQMLPVVPGGGVPPPVVPGGAE